jgi:gluconate 2-dehydrogenase gamma chain
MSDITRRAALGQLAAAFAVAGTIDRTVAAEGHEMLQRAAAGRTYAPKALSAEQFRTLETLTDLIIPVENGKPGAVQAQVPAWIDSLLNVNAELQSTYVNGLGWLDDKMKASHGSPFVSATPEQQAALLDTSAYRKNLTPELAPAIDFFVLARRMTVDGFYTSPIGMRDIYPGNTPLKQFTVPKEAMDYVLGRSPFKQ